MKSHDCYSLSHVTLKCIVPSTGQNFVQLKAGVTTSSSWLMTSWHLIKTLLHMNACGMFLGIWRHPGSLVQCLSQPLCSKTLLSTPSPILHKSEAFERHRSRSICYLGACTHTSFHRCGKGWSGSPLVHSAQGIHRWWRAQCSHRNWWRDFSIRPWNPRYALL